MKKVLLSITMLGALFLVSCGEKEESEKKEGEQAEAKAEKKAEKMTLNVDTEASKVEWNLGNKMDSSYFHTGYVNLSEGSITVKNGQITSGSFDVDITSITNTDLEEGKKENLEGHLKSGEFFDVENYPVASFKIKNVEGETVTGDLTVIGNTTEVSFDLENINVKDNSLVADASFMVDRFDIGVTFMSEKDGTPEEKQLQRHIRFDVHLEAHK